MAITTLQAANDALPGQTMYFNRNGLSGGDGNLVNMVFISSWAMTNGNPGTGATPSSGLSGDVPTDATTGAFPFVNPASGNTYLARLQVSVRSTVVPHDFFCLYDRLWHNSGTNVTIATAQTVNSVALTRPNSTGTGAEAWWHVYATMGAGTPTVTLSYTNSAGTASRTATSLALATTMPTNRTGQFNLAAGDTGVQSIQSWTASATFTSGTINLVIRRPIVMCSVLPMGENEFNAVQLGMPRIYDDACIEMLFKGFSNQTVNLIGNFSLIQG